MSAARDEWMARNEPDEREPEDNIPDAVRDLDDDLWWVTTEALREADAAHGSPRCRECGCTDHVACTPPCWWEEPDLCSSCAGRAVIG